MKKSEKIAQIKAFHARIREEQGKGSTGIVGKLMDFYVRDYLMSGGVRKAADVRCRANGKTDWTIKVSGVLCKGETKTNMGEFKAPSNWTADDIFPGYAYVAYTAEVEGLTEDNFMDNMFMFTREQFIELLTVTGRKGLESSLRYNAKHGTLGIQPWKSYIPKTGKWCEARLNKYYDFLDNNGIPTLREFREAVRG